MKKINVYKIGGALINESELLGRFLDSFCHISGPKILIHGGGRKATLLSKQLGIETSMIDGRRITDAATLEIGTMVYAGLISKTIISQLRKRNTKAIGLCGADLGIVTAHKRVHPTIDYGYVGDIDAIDATSINNLLEINTTPVFCAISDDRQGQLLNTNADTMASRIASALSESGKVSLHYVFEFDGVMKDISDPTSLIEQMDSQTFEALKADGTINGGMIPKITTAIEAKQEGVDTVRICGLANVLNQKGTFIV